MDTSTYGLMQTDDPFKSYTKTILAKVFVNVLNPFTGEVEGIILVGNPKEHIRTAIVDIWTEKGDSYFRNANQKHFEDGTIIPYTKEKTEPTEEEHLNTLSDEEIEVLLKSKFFTLSNAVSKMTAVAPVYRTLEMAKELEKSEKIIKFLEGKISELQMKEYELPEKEILVED
jgi:hypothetical protein